MFNLLLYHDYITSEGHMIYTYTDNRANTLRNLMFKVKQSNVNAVVFNYGKNFKFEYRGWSFEVSHYDNEIIVRKLK